MKMTLQQFVLMLSEIGEVMKIENGSTEQKEKPLEGAAALKAMKNAFGVKKKDG